MLKFRRIFIEVCEFWTASWKKSVKFWEWYCKNAKTFDEIWLNFLKRSGGFLSDSKGAACLVHFLFATPLGHAASLRSDGFVSGAVCFVRRALARSAFPGFQIGFKNCKIWNPKWKKPGKNTQKIQTRRWCKRYKFWKTVQNYANIVELEKSSNMSL